MSRFTATEQYAPSPRGLAGLCLLGALIVGCASATTKTVDAGGSAGSGGTPVASGGSGGSSSTSTGGSGGSATGGSGGDTAGSGGSATGGSSGTGGDSGGAVDAGGSSTGGASGGDTDGGPGAGSGGPGCPDPKTIKNRTLPGLSPEAFCNGYEKYCMYSPDGKLMSKCGVGQPIGPLYKDRADCIMKYTMASPGAKACRAGQMCVNAPANLIENACSHATGYCASACK